MVKPPSDLIRRLALPELPGAEPLFREALTHSSADTRINYERMEFLGDAVLKLAISELLFERLPVAQEGDLTKIRARVVSDATLAKIAHRLDLGAYLIMSEAERKSGGVRKVGTLAAAYEALLAAIYRSHGWKALVEHVALQLDSELTAAILEPGAENTKALLQEATQERFRVLPRYRLLATDGPAHQQSFLVEVEVLDRVLGQGRGASKQSAEKEAAREALSRLDELSAPATDMPATPEPAAQPKPAAKPKASRPRTKRNPS